MNSRDSTTRPRGILRTEYMVERHHVTFESGEGWHCECAEFVQLDECKHTRECRGRRAAQTLIAKRVRFVDGTLERFSNREQDEVIVHVRPANVGSSSRA